MLEYTMQAYSILCFLMIPFHRLYSWLFKSFNIDGETELVTRLMEEGYPRIMIIKRSWIFALFMLWIPLLIIVLSGVSIFIAYYSLEIALIKYILIGGNLLMDLILVVSSISYIGHFREIHREATVRTDINTLRLELQKGDTHFKRFFDWSITNQFILIITLVAEIVLIFLFRSELGEHIWVLTIDSLVIITEILFLKMYRKKMLDLEMDYNIAVPGKLFFVNQSGVLSSIQTLESEKIKTVRSTFPNKIASLFNYGNIDVLTEGDDQAMLGTMNMYYVTNPDDVVANIQSLLDEDGFDPKKYKKTLNQAEILSKVINEPKTQPSNTIKTREHTIDTRGKVRDVLE